MSNKGEQLQADLKRALEMMDAHWDMQNNKTDKDTRFIYTVKTLDELLKKIEETGVDQNNALHRWFNFNTGVPAEYIFCEFGAVHETNEKSHDVDIYINEIPFDVKLSVYPSKLSDRPYDLKTREGLDQLIQWFYDNQSKQGRYQFLNRLYIVCDGKNTEDNMRLKTDYDQMRKKIKEFMDDVQKNGLHKLKVQNPSRTESKELYSDIIIIEN